MGLKGQLEDLSLIDMIQISAFSKKSGCLRVVGPPGRGAILLREGRVRFAFSWSTFDSLHALATSDTAVSPEALREHIEASVRELAGLREGTFEFELEGRCEREIAGIPLDSMPLASGLDPQELLLDIAVEIDRKRKEATDVVELAFQGQLEDDVDFGDEGEADELVALDGAFESDPEPSQPVSADESSSSPPPSALETEPASSTLSVVLVDDEAPVREVVGGELQKSGRRVFVASSPAEGMKLLRACQERGEEVLLVVDLKMPTTSGRSFYGGFELLRRARKASAPHAVLLMVESLAPKARATARQLGVRRVVHKPTLTKPDPDLYRADLIELAKMVHAQLERVVEDRSLEIDARADAPVLSTPSNGAAAPWSGGSMPGADERRAFLSAMTKKLLELRGSTDISRLVLRVAARFLERGILFVVKDEEARGLAGFGIGDGDLECAALAQKIRVDVPTSPPFAEVLRRASTNRLARNLDGLVFELFQHIGRGSATEAILIPVLFNRTTLLILYGDNGNEGGSLERLEDLELFLAQAGMALENKLLQRKLGGADGVFEANVGRA